MKLPYVLTLVLCMWLTELSVAQVNPLSNFPLVGVTRAQTLQINVLADSAPCSAQLGFEDSNGSAVGTTESVNLDPGHSASLAIKGTSLTSVKDRLVEVLPKVVVNPNQANCVASAEVFTNSSGVTNVLVAGAVGYLPVPTFALLGVTSTQTVRLNVVAYPPTPCDGTLSFLNTNGSIVGSTLNFQLEPGQAASLDLPGSTLIAVAGQRVEVNPVVSAGSGSGCVASVEVFANNSEVQAAFYPPTPCAPSSTSCVTF